MTALDAILIFISCAAAVYDYRFRKIPNWLILLGIAFGITLNAYHGTSQLVFGLTGLFVGIGVLFLPFTFGWIGAGDVKYFGVVGVLLGVGWLPRVFFYSALVAGLISAFYLAVGIARMSRFREYWMGLKLVVVSMGNVMPDAALAEATQRRASVPWGVAFAAGTIFAYYFDPAGRWAGF